MARKDSFGNVLIPDFQISVTMISATQTLAVTKNRVLDIVQTGFGESKVVITSIRTESRLAGEGQSHSCTVSADVTSPKS